jgi:hypothetical protein
MGQFFPYSSRLNGMPMIGHCRKRSFFFLLTPVKTELNGLTLPLPDPREKGFE